jgi:hypothetical protein
VAAATAAVTVATAARADAGPGAAELKAARNLFTDAVKDEDAGRWSDALDKLHRVASIKLTPGIRYHVALCEEHLGHLVSALDAFTAAQAQARADGARDVLRLVGKHLDDLGPRVPRLTVRVLPGDATATVKIDGNPLPASSVGTPIPVDPGTHQLEASAEPRSPAVATVTLQERDVTSIDLKLGDVPAVAPLATPGPATPPAPPSAATTTTPTTQPAPTESGMPSPTTSPGSNTRTGAILATSGAVLLAASGVLSFELAGNAVTTGQQQCAAQRGPCDAEKNTVRAWDFTAAGAWIGAAAVGTVAVLMWMQPQTPSSEPTHARLFLGPTSAGVWGQF